MAREAGHSLLLIQLCFHAGNYIAVADSAKMMKLRVVEADLEIMNNL